MSKIEKLMTIKEKIINKIVSIKNIEKTKSNFIFKGSIFKKFLKDPQGKCETIIIGFWSFLALIIITFPIELGLAISLLSLILILVAPLIFMYISDYLSFRKKLIKNNERLFEKLNPEKINEIKKNLTNDFNQKELKTLLEGNLSKEDLEGIFFVMNEIIGKEKLFKIFKKLDFKGSKKNINDPYVLILIINEAIKNIKNKEQEEKENVKNEFLKENKEILNLLTKKQKEKTIEYEVVKL